MPTPSSSEVVFYSRSTVAPIVAFAEGTDVSGLELWVRFAPNRTARAQVELALTQVSATQFTFTLTPAHLAIIKTGWAMDVVDTVSGLPVAQSSVVVQDVIRAQA